MSESSGGEAMMVMMLEMEAWFAGDKGVVCGPAWRL